MSDKKQIGRPIGMVSTKEMNEIMNENNWHQYKAEAKEWAEKNNKDIGEVRVEDRNTRGKARKYYRADVLLDFWVDVKSNTALSGGPAQFRKVKNKLEKFAKEL